MRPSQYVVLVVAVSALAATAVPASTQTVLAARAGISIATLAYESDLDQIDIGHRRGVAVGVSVTHYLAENIGVRLGGAFVPRGAEASFQGATDVLRINYVELSPLFDVRALLAAGDREVSLHLLAGPIVSFKRSCENDPPDDGGTRPCKDLELDVATVDVGATVGAGFQFQVLREPSVALSAEAFYSHGFREVQNVEGVNPAKSRAISVQAGLSFPVG